VKPTRLISPPGTYFVTSSTWQRRRLFVVESMARLFLRTLYGYRRQGRYQLHAFVLMPDHFHLLLTPSGDTTLERAMQLIKGGYSHAVREELGRTQEIWQRGFTDHRIRNGEDFDGHRDYIHRNPIERRIVEKACDYRYCSAFPGFKLDPWPSAAKADLALGA
jgi:putative transposase